MRYAIVLVFFTGLAQANPAIDTDGYLRVSREAAAIESLAAAIPDKDTRILIYCNNTQRLRARTAH